mgnify:CR=1 FL=1
MKAQLTPAPRCVLVIHPKPVTTTESGLVIPDSAIRQPEMAHVARSGYGCKTFAGDTVQFMLGAANMVLPDTSLIPERFCYLMWQGRKGLSPKTMLVHDGWVLLRVPYFVLNQTESGLSADQINETLAQNELTVRFGEVVKAPHRAYDERDPIVSTYIDKSDKVEIKKGDTVYFSRYVITSIMQGAYLAMSAFQDQEGYCYVIIPYKEIICKSDSSGITSLNGYCVARKEKDPRDIGLSYPEGKRSGSFINRYIPVSDSADLKAGETIILPPALEPTSLEPESYKTLKQPLYYFKTYNAIMSIDSENVYFPNSQSV